MTLQIQEKPVAELKPYTRNSKIHDKKQVTQIAASIKEFGFNVPILIDQDNNIIAGHGRVLACKELGIDKVPTISLEHLTEAQKRAFIIADNKLTENAAWDNQMLALEFKELGTLDLSFKLDITGFSASDIDLIITNDLQTEIVDDSKDNLLPEFDTNAPAISKLGDMWQLGKHKLICGDSTKSVTYEQLFEGARADMIICDPPYNVPVGGHVLQHKDGKHPEFAMASGEMTSEEFTEFLSKVFQNLTAYSKNGSIHYVWMDWRHMQEMITAGSNYTELKNLCVWNKTVGGLGSFYRSKHELVFVFKNGSQPHTNNFELGQYGRCRTNVWDYPAPNCFFTDTESGETRDELVKLHPTVRPVAMIVDVIKDCSKHDEIILEPFIGSGTTIIAAEKAGRRCYGIELEPKYVDVAIKRWQGFTGKEAVNMQTGKNFNHS